MKGELNELGLKDFARGELVRVRMTPEIVGQVIGQKDWGAAYLVRVACSTETYWFEDVELETYISAEEQRGGHDEEPPKRNNVVSLATIRAMGRA